jgi:hypothetical protein
MGTWGAGILDNDNSRDVYDSYLERFDAGERGDRILSNLRRDYLDASDEQDRAEFWPAVALAQWECGQLSPQTLTQLRKVVERGDGMAAWREEGAADARRRERALAALVKKLQRKNPRPRKTGKSSRRKAPFEPGACIAFRFPDGRWGGFVALRPSAGGSADSSRIKVLKYRSAKPPTMAAFESPKWLYPRDGRKRGDDPFVISIDAPQVKRSQRDFQQIGQFEAPDDDPPSYAIFGDVPTIIEKYY